MKKLKAKYKWQERERHFEILEGEKKFRESLKQIIMANSKFLKLYEGKCRETGGIIEFQDIHWTYNEEELKQEPRGSLLVSAMEKVGGTTIP